MAAKSVLNWVIARGIIVGPSKVNFLTYPLDIGNPRDGVPTQVVGWSKAGAQSFMVEWEAKALAFSIRPSPHLLIVGPFGDAKVLCPNGVFEAELKSLPDGPLVHGPLTDARTIGEHIYVSGIHRQLYRRECKSAVSQGTWVRCDSGLVVPSPSNAILGITSVDGFDESEMYAVGWQGEIWHGKPNNWSCIEPFTNLKFERVVCGPNGSVYALGQAGLIAKGRGDKWSVIDQGLTTDNFWGAEWFLDSLWLCTRRKLYRLHVDDTLTEVTTGLPNGADFGWLSSDEEQLWSFGGTTLMYSFDGVSWSQVVLETSS